MSTGGFQQRKPEVIPRVILHLGSAFWSGASLWMDGEDVSLRSCKAPHESLSGPPSTTLPIKRWWTTKLIS